MDVVLATSFGYHINLINGEVDELNEVFQTVLRFTRENSFRNTKILYCKRDLAGQGKRFTHSFDIIIPIFFQLTSHFFEVT